MWSRIVLFLTLLCALVTFGCQKARWTYSFGSQGLEALGSVGSTDEMREAIRTICATSVPETLDVPLTFPQETAACAWNSDGNLGQRDLHFQARREQIASFQLPSDSVVCDMGFEFQPQVYYYDDEFLFTFNNKVLASSYDFSALLPDTNGLLDYAWSRIVGLPWTSAQPTAYCAGEESGSAQCSFPVTSTNGAIALDYDPLIVQEAFAQSPKSGRHEFRWITTGDDDPAVDCRHSQVDALVRVSYVRIR
jgi:hypothetical protein